MPPCGGAPLRRALEQEAELLLGLFGREAQQGEDLRLDDRVVAADRAAAALLAVDDQVVRLGPDLGRVGVEQVQVLEQRHRERVVLGDEPLFLGVPGEEREPDDPRVMERLRVVELELGRQPGPQVRERLAGDRLGVGDDQDQVAGLGVEPLAELRLGLGREELGGRAGQGVGLDLEPDQALGAECRRRTRSGRRGPCGCIASPPPGAQIPRIRWPASLACWKTLNSVCAAMSATSFSSRP